MKHAHEHFSQSASFHCQHFQRDIVRGVEGYIVTGSKQVEIGKAAMLFSNLGVSLSDGYGII